MDVYIYIIYMDMICGYDIYIYIYIYMETLEKGAKYVQI